MSAPGDRLDVRGVAALWNTTERAIRKRVERGTIPFRRDGSRVVFFLDELERYRQGLEGVGVEEAIARARGEVST